MFFQSIKIGNVSNIYDLSLFENPFILYFLIFLSFFIFFSHTHPVGRPQPPSSSSSALRQYKLDLYTHMYTYITVGRSIERKKNRQDTRAILTDRFLVCPSVLSKLDVIHREREKKMISHRPTIAIINFIHDI